MPDIAVRGLFATPVAAVQLPDAAARNAALRATILARRDATPSAQASSAGGRHSPRDRPAWGGPAATGVLDLARQVATRMTAERHGQPVRPRRTTQACASVNRPGAGSISHDHPGAFWSGTDDVEDGGCADDPTLGGGSGMPGPRGATPGMQAPALKFAGEDGASAAGGETIRPRPGLLVLFPSWLFHQVRPDRGSALRISIAFNLGVADAA